MAQTNETILAALKNIVMPDGDDLVSHDIIRALNIVGDSVSFVIVASDAAMASRMEPIRKAAEMLVANMDGISTVSVVLTAHSSNADHLKLPLPPKDKTPPNLTIGRHPTAQAGPESLPGVDRIIAIGSGKGGVGKSTVSSNLAVALAKQGRRVGLLDADIYGPSQPRMMGVNTRPGSPDGKTIIPLKAHGVTMMSIGLMTDPSKAIVWRGPMLMGALQQMLTQVEWGELDVLLVDLPPGTGDVQLTLCQKTQLNGAIVVSTPQDVALIDARKAIDMFNTLKTPLIGLIENMSIYKCPNCGHEAHLFGHGGVKKEAEEIGAPFLVSLPIDLDTRLAGDAGMPIAAGDGPMADVYAALAKQLIGVGMS